MLSVYEGGPSERGLDLEFMLGQTELRRSKVRSSKSSKVDTLDLAWRSCLKRPSGSIKYEAFSTSVNLTGSTLPCLDEAHRKVYFSGIYLSESQGSGLCFHMTQNSGRR